VLPVVTWEQRSGPASSIRSAATCARCPGCRRDPPPSTST